MPYESPIEIMFNDMCNQIEEQRENQVMATIREQYAINVDKAELLKALAYDRNQYEKGYEDAKRKYERPKGKWKLVEHGKDIDFECPFCGYERGNLSYGYSMEEILKDISEDDIMLPKFCESCGADMRGEDYEEVEE